MTTIARTRALATLLMLASDCEDDGDDTEVQEVLAQAVAKLQGFSHTEPTLTKCDTAIKALSDACAACESMLTRDLQPAKGYDQTLAAGLLSEATGDFASANKKLRMARALLAYATRPD